MSDVAEREMLERMVPDLQAEGYDVYVRPNRPLVPALLGDFTPDAVAYRADRNLVVEVLQDSPEASATLSRLKSLLQGQDKWQLRVIWLSPSNENYDPGVQKVGAISARINEMRQLAASGHSEPAMLVGWATFEALARASMQDQLKRPQSPARLVHTLAADGVVTPREADLLRVLADKRNLLIHGDLQVRVTATELEEFAGILDTMMGLVAA